MQNLKIRVNSDNASEVIDLLVGLGYKALVPKERLLEEVANGNNQIVDIGNGLFTTVNFYDVKEITISELWDMVVLKRNDRTDANVEEENCLYDLYLTKSGNLYFYHCGKNKWILSNISGDESYYKSLKPIKKPMQEYLNTETYEYKLAHSKPDGEWVCIPEGAEIAIKFNVDDDDHGVIFYKNDGKAAASEKDSFEWDYDSEWSNAELLDENFASGDIDLSHKVLWVRPQQPEALPFIDDEPQSLNEQYAEIEQVRQAGLKLDNGKPRHSLLPKGSISSIITVLEFGAKKYEANNWQKVDNAKERYYDAAMRHIDSWWNGEKFDQETGIHHLAHAATNLFFLKWFDDKENNNGY